MHVFVHSCVCLCMHVVLCVIKTVLFSTSLVILPFDIPFADGPSGVTVTGPTNVTGDLQNLTLTCTFTEVYPSANFTWNIPCATLNSTADVSTCTLDGGLLEDGTTAVCLVFNSAVPELKATDSYKFPVTGE